MPHTPAQGAWQDPGTMTGQLAEPACRVVPAMLHSPFGPVGYVLVDGHLLYPAIWRDGAPPPAIGDLVAAEVPYGRPAAEALPLCAYMLPPGQSLPAIAPTELRERDIPSAAGPLPQRTVWEGTAPEGH
jgi:hypothetical protein